MAWLIPSPRELLGAARGVADWSLETAALAVTLPGRVGAALTDVELLLQRVSKVVDEAEATVGEVRTVAMDAKAVVGIVELVAAQAQAVVGTARVVALEAGDVVGTARAVALDAADVVGTARVVALDAGEAVGAARGLVVQTGDVLGSARGLTLEAADTLSTAQGVAGGAGELVLSAEQLSGVAQELLDLYRPLAQQAAPKLRSFLDSLSEKELQAIIRFVDHAPVLVEHMESDILPILETLDRVGPDVSDLLEVAKDVREAAVGIPGFKFFRKRGEQKIEDDEDEAGPVRTDPTPDGPATRPHQA